MTLHRRQDLLVFMEREVSVHTLESDTVAFLQSVAPESRCIRGGFPSPRFCRAPGLSQSPWPVPDPMPQANKADLKNPKSQHPSTWTASQKAPAMGALMLKRWRLEAAPRERSPCRRSRSHQRSRSRTALTVVIGNKPPLTNPLPIHLFRNPRARAQTRVCVCT